jgi:hypothetical protein
MNFIAFAGESSCFARFSKVLDMNLGLGDLILFGVVVCAVWLLSVVCCFFCRFILFVILLSFSHDIVSSQRSSQYSWKSLLSALRIV